MEIVKKENRLLKIYQFLKRHAFLFLFIIVKLFQMYFDKEKFTLSNVFITIIIMVVLYTTFLWVNKKQQ